MNRSNTSALYSIALGSAKGVRRGRPSAQVASLLAAGLIACCWAARTCDAQIQVEAYITNNLSNNVSVIDTRTNSVVRAIPVGLKPEGVAVSPDGRFVYVANTNSNTVSVINAVTNAVVSLPTMGSFPIGVAVTPDGKFAYVTNQNSNNVSVIDTTTNKVALDMVGSSPIGVAVAPGGRLVYVVNNLSNSVSVINTTTNAVTSFPVGSGSLPIGVAVSPDGKFAYVTNTQTKTVSVIDTTTNVVVASPAVGSFPVGVVVTPDGKFVYVANPGDSSVSVIDTTTNTTVGSPIALDNLGLSPEGLAITPNGGFVYTGNIITNNVSVINTATNSVVNPPIPVGSGPVAFGNFIGPNIIVALGGPLLIANDSALTSLGFGSFVDFNGGTLQTTGSLITSRTISLLDSGGTVNSNGFDSIFSGDIINSGMLTKIGAGTLTLSGNNSYSGGTSILGGAIRVSSDINLGTGNINISNNGELLTTGAAFISGKTIALGAGGGTLASANSTTATYGGVVSGSQLTIGDGVNQGTIILSAANTYNGGTTINRGTVEISADVNLGAASGALIFNGGTLQTLASFSTPRATTLNAAGGTLAPGAGTTFTEAGNITGIGQLTKAGAGSLTLSGNNTYSGGTQLNEGTLVVNSAQALGLGNVVVNGGVLRADPQPINVKGNYSQNAGGILQLTLGGSASGQYDFLNVGGRAALDGTLQLLSLNGFQPKIGDKLTLVLAAGGVSGQFANVINPFSSLNGLELIYEPNSVVLEFASEFAAFARTPNERAIAAQLDRLASDPREAQLISFLHNEPLNNLGADFEKISPDSLSALYEISFSAANVQQANLENRFAEVRNGSTGFSSSLSVSNPPGTVVEDKDGKTAIEPRNDVLAPSPENKWGLWISGSGQFVNVSGDGNGHGYDFTTGGVNLGLDYRLTGNLTVGIAVGYAHNWTNLTGSGSIDVNSGKGELYAAFSQGGFYLNGYAGGGYNSYDTRRDGLGGDAIGSTSGGEFDGYFGGGYEFRCGGFTFGPIASLQGTYVGVSGYNESGSLAPLRIVSQSQASLRTNVGLGVSHTWKFGKVQLKPSLRASWQHEYLYSALPVDAQFASGAGSVFTVDGPAEGHDSALIDAGMDVQWTPTFGTYFGYNGDVGRSNYDSNSVIGSVHVDF
jgi:outer membrane autotransporter protein